MNIRRMQSSLIAVTAVTMGVLWMSIGIPRVGATEPSPTANAFDPLIADVLPAYKKAQELAAIDALPDEVAPIQGRKPVETSDWKNLSIGEFESDEAFKQRQEQARRQESLTYQASLDKWNQELAMAEVHQAARANQRTVVSARDVAPKLVAHDPDKLIGVLLEGKFTAQCVLPHFDRTLGAFDHVPLDLKFADSSYQGDSTILGQFNALHADLRIRIDDLSVAQKFKEDAAAGKVLLLIRFEPWLKDIESPIITKPEHEETVTDKNAVAGSTVGILIAAVGSAMGGDSNAANMITKQSADDIANGDQKTVDYPAETRAGVRFHFDLDPDSVAVIDVSGKPIPGIDVELLDRQSVSVRCMGLIEDAQEGAKALKRGDELLKVAGKEVENTEDFIADVKAQPAGASFNVTYRSVDDGHEHDVGVTGGRPLGITVMDVYPSVSSTAGN